jgi:hypothetical protein
VAWSSAEVGKVVRFWMGMSSARHRKGCFVRTTHSDGLRCVLVCLSLAVASGSGG